MSALLPIHGQLPAAVALAIAATSPAAGQTDGVPEVRAPEAVQPHSLKAIRDSLDPQSFQVLRWVAELQTGLDDASETFADIRRVVKARTDRLSRGVTLMAAWADSRVADMTRVAGDLGHAGGDAVGAGRLTAFVLRASARMPQTMPATAREGAEAAVYATLQPLYDQVTAFRAVEARLVVSARRAALKADVHAMVARNYEVLRVAKTELLRVVSETAKLAFSEIPPREARAVARDAAFVVPAESVGARPFGRRIDYTGIANRWITGP
ncbi:MAG: hypothetical protein IT548_03915 [Alphaproteobacteria bacterium]|nr:hypothetical protein [Alphaproteobacteria bacterium]